MLLIDCVCSAEAWDVSKQVYLGLDANNMKMTALRPQGRHLRQFLLVQIRLKVWNMRNLLQTAMRQEVHLQVVVGAILVSESLCFSDY